MSDSEEKIYFQNGSVLVSNARFVSGTQTFAMRNVSSVQLGNSSPSILAPLIVGFLGLVALNGVPILGIALIGGAIAWFFITASKYRVMLTASGSVQTGLESRDKALINEVVAALNKAIIERG